MFWLAELLKWLAAQNPMLIHGLAASSKTPGTQLKSKRTWLFSKCMQWHGVLIVMFWLAEWLGWLAACFRTFIYSNLFSIPVTMQVKAWWWQNWDVSIMALEDLFTQIFFFSCLLCTDAGVKCCWKECLQGLSKQLFTYSSQWLVLRDFRKWSWMD